MFHSGVALGRSQSLSFVMDLARRSGAPIWYTLTLWQPPPPHGILIITMPPSGERCPDFIKTTGKDARREEPQAQGGLFYWIP